MVHEVPDRPWAKVRVDLFKFAVRDYLCTVDYMSNFSEIDHLPRTQAKTVITKLKHHFARQGIPDQEVTDNGCVRGVNGGVMVIVAGNGLGDTSSNPGRD